MTKTAGQLLIEHADDSSVQALLSAYMARSLLRRAIVHDGKLATRIAEKLEFTGPGAESLDWLRKQYPEVAQADLQLAVFFSFFHQAPLIDCAQTDWALIHEWIAAALQDDAVVIPDVHGRWLYDRYYSLHPDNSQGLTKEQTLDLLSGSTCGIAQVGSHVAGPWGILASKQGRYLPPPSTAPLYHCPDYSCTRVHDVSLVFSDLEPVAIALLGELKRRYGPAAEWTKFMRYIAGEDLTIFYDDHFPPRLIPLLTECFAEPELRAILSTLLSIEAKEIRAQFPPELQKGSAEAIASRCERNELLQLILLASDTSIARAIDRSIVTKEIQLPPSETRRPLIRHTPEGREGVRWECSVLGVRAAPVYKEVASQRLQRLILRVFEKNERSLEWHLRHVPDPDIESRLSFYVRNETPRDVVRALVLADGERLEAAIRALQYASIDWPSTKQEEERVVDRILWKLGFPIHTYPDFMTTFWTSLESLSAATLDPKAGADRSTLRGFAANMFVALEVVLEQVLALMTWATLRDHYGAGQFVFSLHEARRFLAQQLSNFEKGPDGNMLAFDPKGRTTLHPLIRGLEILAAKLRNAQQDPTLEARPTEDMPGYHVRGNLEKCAHGHRIPFLDMRSDDQLLLIGRLERVHNSLAGASVASLRNRFEHNRDDFPTAGETKAVVQTVRAAIEELETAGLVPLVQYAAGSHHDAYGRGVLRVVDYKGQETTIPTPSFFGAPYLPVEGPLVVLRSLRIAGSQEPMCFTYRENSQYRQMWAEYPKKELRAPH